VIHAPPPFSSLASLSRGVSRRDPGYPRTRTASTGGATSLGDGTTDPPHTRFGCFPAVSPPFARGGEVAAVSRRGVAASAARHRVDRIVTEAEAFAEPSAASPAQYHSPIRWIDVRRGGAHPRIESASS